MSINSVYVGEPTITCLSCGATDVGTGGLTVTVFTAPGGWRHWFGECARCGLKDHSDWRGAGHHWERVA